MGGAKRYPSIPTDNCCTSELLRDIVGKPLDSTFVIIEEVDNDNWGAGGLPALEYRRKRAAAAE